MSQSMEEKTQEIYDRLSSLDGVDIQRMDAEPEKMKRTGSGSYKLDEMLGGGWPEGRLCEVYGPPSGGKTTIALEAAKAAQEAGKIVGFVDAEHSLDPNYAFDGNKDIEGIGVDNGPWMISQPDSGESALHTVEKMVEEDVGFIIVDSVAALTPEAELEGDIDDDHVGLQARLMSQHLRTMKGKANAMDTTVIYLNQIRMKIGVMFGNPETTPGGKALKFYSSIRLRVSPSSHVKEGGDKVGQEINARVTKNKTAPPFKSDTLNIRFGAGLDKAYELAQYAQSMNAVQKAGAWIKIGDTTLCQGDSALRNLVLHNDPADPEADDVESVPMKDRLEKRMRMISRGELEPTERLELSDFDTNDDVEDDQGPDNNS
jgi:recombination protein RecA